MTIGCVKWSTGITLFQKKDSEVLFCESLPFLPVGLCIVAPNSLL